MHVRQRAETLLTNNHYDPESVREIADGVTSRWQQLVTRAEERHKLVTASLNFYKTAEQVKIVNWQKRFVRIIYGYCVLKMFLKNGLCF